jgi:hypothetical protein
MAQGILIKEGTSVIEKKVYVNFSTPEIQTEIARLSSLYPSASIVLYESDQDTDFITASI